MAVTAGILNGTEITVFDDTHAILHATDCTVQISQSGRDASTKASSGWKASLPGQRSWTVSQNGLIALDVSYNLAYLFNLIVSRTLVTLYIKTANAADYYLGGTAYLTSAQMTAPNNNNVTYSCSFEGTGILSVITPGSGSGSQGGITDSKGDGNILPITQEITVSGLNDLYIFNSATAVAAHLDIITNISAAKMGFINKGAGTATIDAADGLLIDGHASIDLNTGQKITIFPNDTEFIVIGTYGKEE